jgi:transcriptional regulator with XRE-family HTH domain
MFTGIGERLRKLRHERGLSQEEVARRTGIGLKSYGDLERGKATDPHYSTLRGIARALEVTVEELVEEPIPLAKASETGSGSVDVAEQSGLDAVRSFLRARTGTAWLARPDDEWDQWSLGVTRDEVLSRYEQIKAEWQLLNYERAAIEHGEPSVLRREGTQEVLNKMWPRVLEARYTAPREEESDKEFQRRRLEDKKFRTFYAPLEELQPREAGTEDPSKEDAGA